MLIRTWLVEMMTRIFLIITVMRSDANWKFVYKLEMNSEGQPTETAV